MRLRARATYGCAHAARLLSLLTCLLALHLDMCLLLQPRALRSPGSLEQLGRVAPMFANRNGQLAPSEVSANSEPRWNSTPSRRRWAQLAPAPGSMTESTEALSTTSLPSAQPANVVSTRMVFAPFRKQASALLAAVAHLRDGPASVHAAVAQARSHLTRPCLMLQPQPRVMQPPPRLARRRPESRATSLIVIRP